MKANLFDFFGIRVLSNALNELLIKEHLKHFRRRILSNMALALLED